MPGLLGQGLGSVDTAAVRRLARRVAAFGGSAGGAGPAATLDGCRLGCGQPAFGLRPPRPPGSFAVEA